MKIRTILSLSLCFITANLSAMEQSKTDLIDTNYNYRRATENDLPNLVNLINTEAIYEHQKIVILPKKFRGEVLLSAIKKNRIFIVEKQGEIIGFKKLFLVTDTIEKTSMLQDEIRSLDNEENCSFAGYIDNDGSFVEDEHISLDDCYDICIYNGSDFTAESHRGKGLNQMLTIFALLSIAEDLKAKIQDQEANSITMLYGITEQNAGEKPGDFNDRTISILKIFKIFIRKLENNQDAISFHHKRYQAFMPTFDPESNVLIPLPDELSVPGFGCVLTYKLRTSHE